MKSVGLGILWVAVAVEGTWVVAKLILLRGLTDGLLYPLCVTAGVAALAITRGRYRWITSVLRVLIGIAFLGGVCDRLGVFGRPGAPGVSWGNFRNFTVYTGQVNSFLPTSVIPALAVIESIIEGLLGLTMLLGVALRFTVWGSTILLSLFGIAMTISLGFSSTLPFAVFVLAAGALFMTAVDTSFLSVDRLLSSTSAIPIANPRDSRSV